MVFIEIPDAITTIHPIISIVVGFILGIFSTPLSNWVFSKDNEYCAFPEHHNFGDSWWNQRIIRQDIIVKKQFGKTKNINCPYYKSDDTEIKNFNGKKYLSCPFGKVIDPETEDVKKCPFHK